MLVPTEQLTKPDFASILLVGPPKTGKTYSLATLHRVLELRKLPTKMVIFDTDGDGAETLLRLARKQGWIEDIELHRFTKPQRLKDAEIPQRTSQSAHDFINEFNELFDRIDNRNGQWREKPIGAIIVDSITGLQDIYEDFVWQTRQKEIGGKETHAIDWNDWRLLQEKIMEVYMNAKTLPCYSVFTAHVDLRQITVRGTNDPKTSVVVDIGHVYEVPLVSGQLAMRIAKDFGVVLYTTSDYKWQTRPNERIRSAGTRGKDGLPALINQDFAEVLDI